VWALVTTPTFSMSLGEEPKIRGDTNWSTR
jgi:hypothetical protein